MVGMMRSRLASISAQNSSLLTQSLLAGLGGLGLSSFFARRHAAPNALAMAVQPSAEMLREEAIGELRLVFMMRET